MSRIEHDKKCSSSCRQLTQYMYFQFNNIQRNWSFFFPKFFKQLLSDSDAKEENTKTGEMPTHGGLKPGHYFYLYQPLKKIATKYTTRQPQNLTSTSTPFIESSCQNRLLLLIIMVVWLKMSIPMKLSPQTNEHRKHSFQWWKGYQSCCFCLSFSLHNFLLSFLNCLFHMKLGSLCFLLS